MTISTRADIITKRTYCRPVNEEGTEFETWEQVVDRVISHQRWLWERALTHKTMPEMPLRDITEDMYEWIKLDQNQEKELRLLRSLILDRKVAPAGRTLWLGGTDIGKKIELSQFNCAAIVVRTVHDMVDFFWGLLNGAGVTGLAEVGTLTGFRYKIPELKIIRTTRGPYDKGPENNIETWDIDSSNWTIKVGDSAIAWAKSIGKLLAGKYPAKTLTLDFSNIRGPGARLRNYGWISQSDTGLSKAYTEVFKILNARADSLLTEIDINDIINLLGTVLSTRRAAEALLMRSDNPRWKEFATAKQNIWENGKEHRAQSNNSLLFYTKPSKKELSKLFDMINKGGNGEPGLVNAKHMKERAPWGSGLNPCVTGDTLVQTSNGLEYVSNLIGTPFKALVNGELYDSKKGFWYTGNKEVFKLVTDSGAYVKATSNHKILTRTNEWKELSDISIGEEVLLSVGRFNSSLDQDEFNKGWLVGEVVGDGGHNPGCYHSYVRFWGDNKKVMFDIAYDIVSKLPYNYTRPTELKREKCEGTGESLTLASKAITDLCSTYIEDSTKEFKHTLLNESDSFIRGFLSGVFDADGSVQGNLVKGVSIRLVQTSLEKLEIVQQMLLRFGIVSKLYKNRQPEGYRLLPNSNREYVDYWCKASHELIISNYSFTLFGKYIGFKEPDKQNRFELIEGDRKRKANQDKNYSKVISIERLGYEDVYDCTVEDVHRFSANGIIVHNCFEILLSDGSTCNLVTIDLNKFKEDNQGLWEATRLITRANYRQTVVDFRDGVLQEKWHLNNDHLHLCGVSLMGIAMRPDMQPYDYVRLERVATHAAYSMAEELGTPYPKNISANKPEGTISKCYDSTEGMHTPLGKYIFNNVAFSKFDPLLVQLREANYNVFNHPYDDSAVLVTFPVKYDGVEFDIDENGKEVNLESAVSQLERYLMLMKYYCHQNVSCTISYSMEETEDIVEWLHNNWDNYVAVSFLFRNDPSKTAADLGYPYLPQEVVNRETYETYVSQLLPMINSTKTEQEEVEVEIKHVQNTDLVPTVFNILDEACATGACPIK